MPHATPPPGRARDPRDIVTPDALHVAPELLGLPLARPWRRAAALSVDGILVAILSNAPGFLLALAASLVLFRVASRRKEGTGAVRGSLRITFALVGALTLFVVGIKTWQAANDTAEAAFASMITDDAPSAQVKIGEDGTAITGIKGLRLGASALRFASAKNEPDARRYAQEMVDGLRAAGMSDAQIRDQLKGGDIVDDGADKPWLSAALGSVLAGLDAPAATAAEPDADLAPAGVDSLALLREQNEKLEAKNGELKAQMRELADEAHQANIVSWLKSFVKDEFGLGLGWVGLYFVATVALFRGRTPGKRLFGIRIIRLNGKPIGWWGAFERFGGYAAGFATGLLGFFQIFWDRNRQGIHDKIAETAVIRDS
ncbi:MAG TPA: RDD family protein [Longimicrobiaceae bacterium]|nr:RDD family protein [Longimicrobiaceae bacterium]